MNLTLTNTTAEPEAIGSPDGDFTDVLQPQTPYEFRKDEISVLVIGDKPDVREQFAAAAERLGSVLKGLILIIAGRKKHAVDAGHPEHVQTAIANHGANAVRVLLGNGTSEQTIQPGTTVVLTAEGYLEVRELGIAHEQGGTPD
jgi:hypothetical protein